MFTLTLTLTLTCLHLHVYTYMFTLTCLRVYMFYMFYMFTGLSRTFNYIFFINSSIVFTVNSLYKQKMKQIYNNFFNNTSRFTNLKNLFNFRSLFILIITLVLSFSARWFIVHYFNYDLSVFKDFFLIGILVSFILNVVNYFSDFQLFRPLLCVGGGNIQASTPGKGDVKTSTGTTYLRAATYNPEEGNSRSSRISRSSNRSSVSRATTTYSVPIKYAPSITRDSISYSRPISELYKADSSVSRVTGNMVLPSRPRYIPSVLPSPLASGTLPLFDNTPEAVPKVFNTMSPLFPVSPSIPTQYTTPNLSTSIPQRVKASNLTTPSTMSPLFPSHSHVIGNTVADSSNVIGNTVADSSNVNSNIIDDSNSDCVVKKHISTSRSARNTAEAFSNRKLKIIKGITTELENIGYSNKEIEIGKKGWFGKIKLGFESFGTDLRSIYVKYDGITRRKLLWTLWEGGKGNYNSYEEFKNSWNPDTKVWKKIRTEIKMSLKKDVENFLDHMRPFDNTLDYSSKTKYMNNRSTTTNRGRGLSNYISDTNKNHTSKGLKDVNARNFRLDNHNNFRNITSMDSNVKVQGYDNSHISEVHHRNERSHRSHRSHRSGGHHRISRSSRS